MRGPESRDLPLLGSLEGFLEVAACQVVLEANWARRGGCSLHQAWKPGSQHAGEKRGVAGLLLGRTERAARAAELQLCLISSASVRSIPFLSFIEPIFA